MTIYNHQIISHELPLAKTVDLENTSNNVIRHVGMLILLHSRHYQALHSFITILHSTWYLVRNKAPVQDKDFEIMGHSGKDMTTTKVVMMGLKWSPLSSVQDKGRHLQVHRECLQDCQETIQSFAQHVPAVLHLDLLPVHLGDPWLTFQQKDSSCQRNREKQMLQGLHTCPHCQSFPTMNMMMMEMMRTMIRQTWAV